MGCFWREPAINAITVCSEDIVTAPPTTTTFSVFVIPTTASTTLYKININNTTGAYVSTETRTIPVSTTGVAVTDDGDVLVIYGEAPADNGYYSWNGSSYTRVYAGVSTAGWTVSPRGGKILAGTGAGYNWSAGNPNLLDWASFYYGWPTSGHGGPYGGQASDSGKFFVTCGLTDASNALMRCCFGGDGVTSQAFPYTSDVLVATASPPYPSSVSVIASAEEFDLWMYTPGANTYATRRYTVGATSLSYASTYSITPTEPNWGGLYQSPLGTYQGSKFSFGTYTRGLELFKDGVFLSIVDLEAATVAGDKTLLHIADL